VLGQLARQNVRRIVLAVGYKHDAIRQHVGTGAGWGLDVTYSVETEPLGTAGAVRLALGHIAGGTFLVLNGDSFFDVSFARLLSFHFERHAVATLALSSSGGRRYGAVNLEDGGTVTAFVEKATRRDGATINGGVYALNRESVASVTEGETTSLEREVFPHLVGHGLYGCVFDAYFVDIGVPEDLRAVQESPDRLLSALSANPD
jgi:mannose-1-phosphate guanylyltransferase